jgi:hypothetical protein
VVPFIPLNMITHAREFAFIGALMYPWNSWVWAKVLELRVSLNVLVKYQSCVKEGQRKGRIPVDVMGASGERRPIGGEGQVEERGELSLVWA